MTAGGFVHEAMLYSSDEDFLAVAVPFLTAAVEGGHPTFLAVNPRLQALVLDSMGDDAEDLAVVEARYTRPLEALRLNQRLFKDHARAGSRPVRIIGEVPASVAGWADWARYEASVNDLYAELPAWGLCPYDTRSTADEVLDDVVRTHPLLASPPPDGHRPNASYRDPVGFIAQRAPMAVDPLERQRPALELHNPAPADARRVVTELGRTAGLDETLAQRQALAAGEVTMNALEHGEPPTRLRAWATDGRVVVAVSDCGTGPDDPYAGLLPDADDGLGLHIAYGLCQTTLTYSAHEFTVHLATRQSA
jgi:anti-sigma regulatory factor (Ser/Thr protein kinase)